MQREAKRDREEFVARVQDALREPIREFLRSQPLADALSVSWVGFCAMELCRAVGMTFMHVWAELLEAGSCRGGTDLSGVRGKAKDQLARQGTAAGGPAFRPSLDR